MANVNKVILIGRLTRDVEVRTFTNGGKVAKFGFAVSNRKKNSQTGQWEDVPMFIDCEVYNRGETGRSADLAEQYLSKGRQVYLEGRLELDTWDDKTTGQKRSKHKLLVENMQFLGPKPDGVGGGDDDGAAGGYAPPRPAGVSRRPAPRPAAQPVNNYEDSLDTGDGFDDEGPDPTESERESDIPF